MSSEINSYLEFQNVETDEERDLKVTIINYQAKTLLKLMNKHGKPKSELEEERLWEIIEERENSNKKIREKVNKLLLSANF